MKIPEGLYHVLKTLETHCALLSSWIKRSDINLKVATPLRGSLILPLIAAHQSLTPSLIKSLRPRVKSNIHLLSSVNAYLHLEFQGGGGIDPQIYRDVQARILEPTYL